MGEFRGILDGSVEIGQAREARASQERMQRERIRAEMQMQQAALKAQQERQRVDLAASTAAANADRALKSQAHADEYAAATRRLDLGEREIALRENEFDAGAEIRRMQQENGALMLKQAQDDFDEDQARRRAQTAFRQSAFGAGVLSAMLNGVVAPKTLMDIDAANGIPTGEPGSIAGMGGSSEGAWYDVVVDDGKGGRARKRMDVSPMAILTIAHTILGEKGAADWAALYKAKDNNTTKMSLATDSFLKAIALQRQKAMDAKDLAKTKAETTFQGTREKALAAEQTRLETLLAMDKTMLPDDAEKMKTTITEIAAARKRLLGIDDATNQDEGKLRVDEKTIPLDNSPSVRVTDEGIIIEENGKVGRIDDTPDNRAKLEARGFRFTK